MSTHLPAPERRLTIVYQDVATLKTRPINSRTIPKSRFGQLARAIQHFGFLNPVLKA